MSKSLRSRASVRCASGPLIKNYPGSKLARLAGSDRSRKYSELIKTARTRNTGRPDRCSYHRERVYNIWPVAWPIGITSCSFYHERIKVNEALSTDVFDEPAAGRRVIIRPPFFHFVPFPTVRVLLVVVPQLFIVDFHHLPQCAVKTHDSTVDSLARWADVLTDRGNDR